MGPLASFPWHRQQQHALAASTDTIVILGGTQGGKTSSAAGILSRLVRREGPIYRRLTEAGTRPLKLWVAPKTGEKAESVWEPLLREMVFQGMAFEYKSSPWRVFTWADSVSRENTLYLKSQDQGLLAFESDKVDAVVFDEEPLDRRLYGAARARMTTTNGVVVMAFTPLHGLCLPAETRVTTGRGLVSIAEVVPGDRVAVRTRVGTVTAVHANGTRPLVEVRTRRGMVLRCTPEHEWWAAPSTARKDHVGAVRRAAHIARARKCRAEKLRAGDWLAFNPGHPKFWPDSSLSADDGYFLGQMVGDGSWHPHRQPGPMKLTTNDPETRDWLRGYLRGHGVTVRCYAKTGTAQSLEWCHLPFTKTVEGWGVDRTQKTHAKRVPEAIWRGSREVARGFLQGLFDSDGHASQTRTRVSYLTTSPDLMRDVQRLLIRFSVFGTVRVTHDGNPRHRARSDMEITGANARRFMALVGFRLPRKQKRTWATAHNGTGMAWDRVVSVRPIAPAPVYCLTVDDADHVFAADGYVSGNSWTHSAFYVPTVRPEYQRADRVWRRGRSVTLIQMGMADNPAAVAGGGVARQQADPTITEAERRTRLFGEYGYTEGLLFPVLAGLYTDQPDSRYLLDSLPVGRAYSWVFTADPNKRHGGLLTAIDHEGIHYAVAEHYAENLPDRLHADRYRDIFTRFQLPEEQVAIYGDPGGAGAQALLNLADCGLYAEPVPKGPGSVKANIEMIRRALWPDPARKHPVTGKLGSPALYFLRSLQSTWSQDGVEYQESRLLWELRQYRQKEGAPPDTPVKEKDDVTDCLAYSYAVRPYTPATDAPVWGVPVVEKPKSTDPLSQKAAEDYQRIVTRLTRSQRRR